MKNWLWYLSWAQGRAKSGKIPRRRLSVQTKLVIGMLVVILVFDSLLKSGIVWVLHLSPIIWWFFMVPQCKETCKYSQHFSARKKEKTSNLFPIQKTQILSSQSYTTHHLKIYVCHDKSNWSQSIDLPGKIHHSMTKRGAF